MRSRSRNTRGRRGGEHSGETAVLLSGGSCSVGIGMSRYLLNACQLEVAGGVKADTAVGGVVHPGNASPRRPEPVRLALVGPEVENVCHDQGPEPEHLVAADLLGEAAVVVGNRGVVAHGRPKEARGVHDQVPVEGVPDEEDLSRHLLLRGLVCDVVNVANQAAVAVEGLVVVPSPHARLGPEAARRPLAAIPRRGKGSYRHDGQEVGRESAANKREQKKPYEQKE